MLREYPSLQCCIEHLAQLLLRVLKEHISLASPLEMFMTVMSSTGKKRSNAKGGTQQLV